MDLAGKGDEATYLLIDIGHFGFVRTQCRARRRPEAGFFGAVKSDATCPAKDRSAPTSAGGTMPDLKGKSENTARDALRSGTSDTVKDASDKGRYILLESNWQVRSEKPPAGTKLSGQPVEFSAVKFGETCP